MTLMFKPWRGPHWCGVGNVFGGRRILVLGESHHSADPSHPVGSIQPEFTIGVVEAYLDGSLHSGAKGFFTRIANLLAPSADTTTELSITARSIWNSLAFYNYIPRIAAESARNNPMRPEWSDEARSKFAEIVRNLEAEAVLVCSDRLWWHWGMDHGMAGAPIIPMPNGEYQTRFYPVAGEYRAIAAHIRHPSSYGWKSNLESPKVHILFDQIDRERTRMMVP